MVFLGRMRLLESSEVGEEGTSMTEVLGTILTEESYSKGLLGLPER